jgi:hypothetical protein
VPDFTILDAYVFVWEMYWFDYVVEELSTNKKDCWCKCDDFHVKIFAIQRLFLGKFDRIGLVSSRTVSTTRSVSSITILALTIASYRKDVKRHFEVYVDIWLLFVYRSALREFCVLNGDSLNVFEKIEISNFEKLIFVCTLLYSGVFCCILSMYNWVIWEFWVVFSNM